MKMTESRNSSNRRVWGFWATAGFGLAIGIVFLITQLGVVGAFAIVRIASNPAASLLHLVEALSANGLVLAISTFSTTIFCVGLIAASGYLILSGCHPYL